MFGNRWMLIVLSTAWILHFCETGLPLLEKSTSLVSAECRILVQQCGDEIGQPMGQSASSSVPVATAETLEPVCGSDGRTYSSRCELQRARCEGHPVRVRHRGTCYGEQKRCWSERHLAQQTAQMSTAGSSSRRSSTSGSETFIPECAEDGSFAPIQCHQATGYCWCVSPDGKPLPGSSIRHRKPNCKKQTKSTPSRRSPQGKKGRNRGCSPNDRAMFNEHVIRLLKEDFNRDSTKLVPRQKEGSETAVIDWKFTKLDRNGNDELDNQEWRQLRRIVRKTARPKKCSRNFPRTCDTDADQRISRAEWEDCFGLGVKAIDSLILAQHSMSLQDTSSAEEAEPVESNDCNSERHSALEEARLGAQGMYVPECTVDNKYSRVQCHNATGFCWCANDVTGKPIPGTSSKTGKPNCDAVQTTTKLKKGKEKQVYQHLTAEQACPGKRKSRLQSELRTFLQENMAAQLRNRTQENHSLQGVSINFARWHFQQLDKNSNTIIDRPELKALRQLLRGTSVLKRCSKRIPAFCDTNSDSRISLDEWLHCLGMSQPARGAPTSPGSTPSPGGKRRGPNPLDRYLKDR